MKASKIALTALMLVFGLALLGGLMPVKADGPTTFTFPGGSLTTTDLEAWGGMNTLVYDAYFDFSAGPTTITVYGMDLTDIWYEGEWPWPVVPESQGAQARFGVTADGFWSLHSIHSAIGYGGGSWDAQGADWDHDDGFRKYLIQNQWSGTTPGATVGNHQYNVEAYIPRTGAGPSVNDPAQVVDRAYNTFDMKITYTPTGTPGEYQVLGWVRLHKAASTDEMAIRPGDPPWGSPYAWVWNKAINNQADPEDAWVPFYDGSWVITGDYTSARPYVQIMNWGVPQTRYHTFSWDSMLIEGTPAPAGEVCVDDDFAGSSPGDSLSGAACGMGTVTFGYNAFATIQDGIDAVSGSTVHVAAGTYSEGVTLTPGKDLTIVGAGRDVVTWICPSDGYCIDGNMQGYTGNMNYEISGLTFNCRDNPATGWGAGIGIRRASNGPLNLSIHDNRFVEDRASGDDTHWATSMLLCHNRYAARDGSGNAAVRVYNNIDETWGGMTMSNSQAYDIYDNVFDGCSDAIYNGHGCPDVTGQTFGDHHIYGNTFMNASDALHPGGLTPAIDWQYYGAGGGTHLPSIIEENVFEDNDTAIRFIMDTDMTYPAHVVRNNNFVDNDFAVRVDGTFAGPLDAMCNWWGAVNGPSGIGPGSGGAVSDNVDFQPWLTQPAPSECDYQGPLTHNVVPSTVAVNTPVILTAAVDDSTTGNSVIASAEYNLDDSGWADMSADDGSFFDEVTEEVETPISAFTEVGIHEVCVRGTDAAGNTGSAECILLVVYDPEGGFVTGGGWIDSPEGAYVPDPLLTGKATFGFVSKYKKGAQTPEGQTEFVFKVADLNFHSSSYDWLVVAGAKAQFKGTGTINGAGNFGFMLTVIDAELTPSTEVDKFRIKIWDKVTDELVYDNQIGDTDDADLTTEIGGGSIVVHTKKK